MKSNKAKNSRAQRSFQQAVKGTAKIRKDASYIGTLSSGYDATTPGIDEDQNRRGKGHQEGVHKGDKTDGGAHFDDKRDEVAKAAQSEGIKKLADALDTLHKEATDGQLGDVQQRTLADTFKSLGREFDKVLDKPGALEGEYRSDAEILVSSSNDEWIEVVASDEGLDVDAAGHPLEDGGRIHTEYEGRSVDEDSMNAEKWFEIGPGTFDDPRDAAEKATSRSNADHFS